MFFSVAMYGNWMISRYDANPKAFIGLPVPKNVILVNGILGEGSF